MSPRQAAVLRRSNCASSRTAGHEQHNFSWTLKATGIFPNSSSRKTM